MTSLTQMNSKGNPIIETVLNWGIPQLNGRKLVTEGVHYGWLTDDIVSQLVGWLKTQHGQNPAVYGERRRGYEVELPGGFVVGVTRQRKGTYKARNWAAYCRVKPGVEPVMTEAETELRQREWEAHHPADDYGLEGRF